MLIVSYWDTLVMYIQHVMLLYLHPVCVGSIMLLNSAHLLCFEKIPIAPKIMAHN